MSRYVDPDYDDVFYEMYDFLKLHKPSELLIPLLLDVKTANTGIQKKMTSTGIVEIMIFGHREYGTALMGRRNESRLLPLS